MDLKKREENLVNRLDNEAPNVGPDSFKDAVSIAEQALKQVREETIQECLDIWKSEHDCPDEDCSCYTGIRELKGKA